MAKLTKNPYIMTLILTLIFIVNSNIAFANDVPKNIIVMISDGCGYNQIDATSLYQYGKTGLQVYESFPIKLSVSTYSIRNLDANASYKEKYDPEKTWKLFDHVKSSPTDSAAAATAMATGFKSYNSAIGVDVNKKPLKNVSQRAKELGKATGVITSVQFSHATPAGFLAHVEARDKYANIAQEMILDSKANIIMGCGNPLFDNSGNPISTDNNYNFVGGEAVWKNLLNGAADFDLNGDGAIDNSIEDCDGDGVPDPWVLIQDASDFQKLMDGDTPKRVIGVPKVFETLQCRRTPIADRDGNGKIEDRDGNYASNVYEDPFNKDVPSLKDMVSGALNVLDNDPDGFIVMIEGGAIDWACHANSLPRLIEEEIEFNKAVETVVNWVENKSNWDETLLIVTADHETGYITGPGSGPDNDDINDSIKPVWNPLVNNGAGNLPGIWWHSGGHTNSLVPIFAKGNGSELFLKYANENDPIRGAYIDNTEIAKVIFDLFDKK